MKIATEIFINGIVLTVYPKALGLLSLPPLPVYVVFQRHVVFTHGVMDGHHLKAVIQYFSFRLSFCMLLECFCSFWFLFLLITVQWRHPHFLRSSQRKCGFIHYKCDYPPCKDSDLKCSVNCCLLLKPCWLLKSLKLMTENKCWLSFRREKCPTEEKKNLSRS